MNLATSGSGSCVSKSINHAMAKCKNNLNRLCNDVSYKHIIKCFDQSDEVNYNSAFARTILSNKECHFF